MLTFYIGLSDGSSTTKTMILTASREDGIRVAHLRDAKWVTRSSVKGREVRGIHQILPIPCNLLFLVATLDSVCLVDGGDCEVLRTFQTGRMQPYSLRYAYAAHRGSTPTATGFTFLTFCYNEALTGELIIQRYVASEDRDAIWIQTPAKSRTDWCTWDKSLETKKRIGNPGVWEILPDGWLIGIRRLSPTDDSRPGAHPETRERMRSRFGRCSKPNEHDAFDSWELWTSSLGNSVDVHEIRPLFQDNGEKAGHLVISKLGPKARVGQRSVAFAFGNVLKIVTIGGSERFGSAVGEVTQDSLGNTNGRKRRPGSSARQRAWS